MTAPQPLLVDTSPVATDIVPVRAGTLRRLMRQPVSFACLGFLLLLVVAAVFAPLVAPHDPAVLDVAARLKGISGQHWLGTDSVGRDTLSRAIYGIRIALRASLQSVGLALVIGVPLGILVGYLGGWWDRLGMRIADIISAVPMLVMAFALIAVLGTGLTNAMLAVSIVFAASYLRIARAVTLALRERLYIDAARVLGYSTWRVVLRHLLPNVRGPLIVHTSILLGAAVLIEAMLSFLGLGSAIGTASWGSMLEEARQYQAIQPLMSVVPGVMITLTVLTFNLLGDGLRDATGQEVWVSRKRLRQAERELARHRSPLVPAVSEPTSGALLSVHGLRVSTQIGGEPISLIDGLDLEVGRAEVFGLVGESGSGKSITSLAISGLLPRGVRMIDGSIRLDGRDLTLLTPRQWRQVRGREIGMVFQDPMAALSPAHTVGRQICEGLRAHEGLGKRAARARAAELLDRVGVPDASARLDDYPHQFSGGMAQRAVIAMALACRPQVLVADEPTTALDVTVQKQVLELLAGLVSDVDMSVLLITHDLGVVSETCHRIAVMYAGQVVETGTTAEVFTNPRHPYTAALLAAMPSAEMQGGRLPMIPGVVPPPWNWPTGCRFHPRCEFAIDRCRAEAPALSDGARCFRRQDLNLVGVA